MVPRWDTDGTSDARRRVVCSCRSLPGPRAAPPGRRLAGPAGADRHPDAMSLRPSTAPWSSGSSRRPSVCRRTGPCPAGQRCDSPARTSATAWRLTASPSCPCSWSGLRRRTSGSDRVVSVTVRDSTSPRSSCGTGCPAPWSSAPSSTPSAGRRIPGRPWSSSTSCSRRGSRRRARWCRTAPGFVTGPVQRSSVAHWSWPWTEAVPRAKPAAARLAARRRLPRAAMQLAGRRSLRSSDRQARPALRGACGHRRVRRIRPQSRGDALRGREQGVGLSRRRLRVVQGDRSRSGASRRHPATNARGCGPGRRVPPATTVDARSRSGAAVTRGWHD